MPDQPSQYERQQQIATEILAEMLRRPQIEYHVVFAATCGVEVIVSVRPRTDQENAEPGVPELAGAPIHAPPERLRNIEQDILTALGSSVMTARQIAERAGYRLNSHFRTIMSGLVRAGYLAVTREGYRRSPG